MKKIILTSVVLFICSCAGKSSPVVVKEEKKEKPVISVLDTAPTAKPKKETVELKKSEVVVENKTTVPTVLPKQESTPKEVIKNYTAELQSIQDDSSLKGAKREKQISEKVRKFFDFDALAQMSLGSYWGKISSQKQVEYSDLFTRLIEKSYLQRSRNLVGNYQLSYGNEKIMGEKATVACEINKDDVDLEIVYELHKNSDRWMIYNVIFDQVNLAKNYQTQFNQIIAKSNISGLMDMMNKKLKEKSSNVDANL